MENEIESKINNFYNVLNITIFEIGEKEADFNENEIAEFCKIIGDNNPIYIDKSEAEKTGLDDKIIPPGYFMNLTTKVIYDIFIKGGPELFSSKFVKGLIHTKSEVQFFKPMLMDQKYKVKIELSKPIKKEGKKGLYYSIIFQISLKDEQNNVYAIDNHDFFFPI